LIAFVNLLEAVCNVATVFFAMIQMSIYEIFTNVKISNYLISL
jgi:hypothetical protein